MRDRLEAGKVLIFSQTKRGCDAIVNDLEHESIRAIAIHGDKRQSARDWVLRQFREGRTKVMVATDVASRGLDVRDIKTVINYDFPSAMEDYIHRIGRTGRAGKTGDAYSFFTYEDSKKSRDLIKILEDSKQQVPEQLREYARSMRGGGGRRSNYRNGRRGGGRRGYRPRYY